MTVIAKDEMLFLLYIRFTQRDLAGVRVGLRMLFELCVCVTQKDLGQSTDALVCSPPAQLPPPTIPVIRLLPQTNAVVARNLDKKFLVAVISRTHLHIAPLLPLLHNMGVVESTENKTGSRGHMCAQRMYLQKHVFK